MGFNLNKPIGLNDKVMEYNGRIGKNKQLKEVINTLQKANFHNPNGEYWQLVVRQAWKDLKNIIDL